MAAKKNICIFFFILLASQAGGESSAAQKAQGAPPDQQSEQQKGAYQVSVSLQGVSDEQKASIRKNLSLLNYQDYASRSPSHIMLLYGEGEGEINDALQPYGYFSPHIDSTIKQTDDKSWHATFRIERGQPVTISKVRLLIKGEGSDDPVFQKIRKNMALAEGEVLTQESYNQVKERLTQVAMNRGYFDATLKKHEIQVNKRTHKAEIHLLMDTGARYHINKVAIKQSSYKYNTGFLHKYITVQKGQPYQNSKVQKTASNFQGTNYFRDIAVVPRIKSRNKKEKTVDVGVDLTASKPVTYSFGGGFGTYTGFRALAEANFHHLTPTGHNATLSAEISEINTSFLAQYLIPGSDPLNSHWSLNARQSFINVIPYNARQTTWGLNYIYQNDWLSSNIGLQEYYIDYNTPASNGNHNDFYLVPSWYIQLDFTEPHGFWNKGLQIGNLFQGSIKSPVSAATFLRSLTRSQYSLPLMDDWNRVLFNGNFGFNTIGNVQDIAPPFRFYAGGVNNLLGFAYLSQGPRNSQGQLTGGKYLMTASAGVEQRVYGKFSVIGFYDIGNATNTLTFKDTEVLHATGIGVGYNSPLGSIQAYLSKPLNPSDGGFRVDISLGMIL